MKVKINVIFWLLLQCVCTAASGQDVTGNLTDKEADSLLRTLGTSHQNASKVSLLLRLAQFNIMKPGENKTDLDRAAGFVVQAETINAKIRSIEEQGHIFLVKSILFKEKGDRKKGREFVENAIQVLKPIKDGHYLGDAYIELSTYFDYFVQEQLDKKIDLVELAVDALKHESKPLKLAYSLQLLADLYTNNGEQLRALDILKASLDNYQSVGYKKVQGVYIIYSTAYSLSSNYKEALRYGLKALKTAEDLQDTSMQLCEIYNIVGVLSRKMKDHRKALDYFKNGLQIAERYNDHNSILLIVSNIVLTYNSLKQYATALQFMKDVPPKYLETKEPAFSAITSHIYCSLYLSLNQADRAKPFAVKLSEIVTRHPTEIASINNAYLTLIKYYLITRQYQFARKFLLAGMTKVRKDGMEVPFKLQAYYALSFKLDSANGNYKAAIEKMLVYNKLKDTVFNEKKSKDLKQLEIEYETVKKASEIKILNQKALLQQGVIEKANLLKDITFVGILILLVFFGLLYRHYRLKQKGNRIVQQNNIKINEKNKLLEHLIKEKEWLLKEVHHRVKNNLHTVICLLESQATYLQDDALKAIESSQHRIYAMSLIHQKLYQSDDVKTIDMSIYVPEFIQYLNDSYDTQHLVRFHLEIEPVLLGVSQAIPLALIVNEAVTNSIKYAFTPGTVGIISISLNQNSQGLTLVIADNGIGLDPAIANMPLESLGLKLMNGLSEDINGRILYENKKGTKITVSFNPDPLYIIQDFSGGVIEAGK